MKDDAIVQISDQVMALTARMQRLGENNKSKLTFLANRYTDDGRTVHTIGSNNRVHHNSLDNRESI